MKKHLKKIISICLLTSLALQILPHSTNAMRKLVRKPVPQYKLTSDIATGKCNNLAEFKARWHNAISEVSYLVEDFYSNHPGYFPGVCEDDISLENDPLDPAVLQSKLKIDHVSSVIYFTPSNAPTEHYDYRVFDFANCSKQTRYGIAWFFDMHLLSRSDQKKFIKDISENIELFTLNECPKPIREYIDTKLKSLRKSQKKQYTPAAFNEINWYTPFYDKSFLDTGKGSLYDIISSSFDKTPLPCRVKPGFFCFSFSDGTFNELLSLPCFSTAQTTSGPEEGETLPEEDGTHDSTDVSAAQIQQTFPLETGKLELGPNKEKTLPEEDGTHDSTATAPTTLAQTKQHTITTWADFSKLALRSEAQDQKPKTGQQGKETGTHDSTAQTQLHNATPWKNVHSNTYSPSKPQSTNMTPWKNVGSNIYFPPK